MVSDWRAARTDVREMIATEATTCQLPDHRDVMVLQQRLAQIGSDAVNDGRQTIAASAQAAIDRLRTADTHLADSCSS
jgi:hypothetical protein